MSDPLRLAGRTVAIVTAEGCHDHEFWYPYYRFQEEGAEVLVAGIKPGTVLGEGRDGKNGLPVQIDHPVEALLGRDLDALYLPGGLYGPMLLRRHKPTLELVRQAMAAAGTIVAAICHGPWILVSAGVVKGRRMTCSEDMSEDLTNAGAIYVDEPAVRDGNLITGEYYARLPEHFRLIISAMLERGPRS